MLKKSLISLLLTIAVCALAKTSKADPVAVRSLGFTGKTVRLLQSFPTTPEEEQLHREQLEACDKAIDAQEETINAQEQLIKHLDEQLIGSEREIFRLRNEADVWYRREPWILVLLGAVAGGLAYSLTD